MVTTRPPKTIVKPTALGPVANTDTKLLIYGLFRKGRVLAQDGVGDRRVIRKKEDRVLTGRQPWELRSCELVFASVEVLHSVAAGPPTQ